MLSGMPLMPPMMGLGLDALCTPRRWAKAQKNVGKGMGRMAAMACGLISPGET